MFIHSWRWFGPEDRISLDQILQTGARNVVTALHQIPVGETWRGDTIKSRTKQIEGSGLKWGVVESVPVHEDIKKRSGQFRQYIENYKQTLKNLGKEHIHTVCYNFMPALDWSRTNLNSHQKDGSEASGFSYIQFAAIDIFILKRSGADEEYTADVCQMAKDYFTKLTGAEEKALKNTFLLGFPGSGEAFTLKEVLIRIEAYTEMDRSEYMSNLKEFLKEIVPVAENEGIKLALHPDDPPWPLMGMPRAVSTLQDAMEIVQTIDSPSNGLTFCTGSFGAAATNDLPLMARELAHRINFLHIRNVVRDEQFNFHESNLFEGHVDIHSVMKTMIKEDIRRCNSGTGYEGIPLRPDHGARILGDYEETYYPGYSLYGRMKNLAEIRGLEYGIRKSL